MPNRLVAVSGASGFVGRHIVRHLLDRGSRVRALVRSAEKARSVLPSDSRLELVTGDVLDGRAPARLAAGADAVVNTIGIIREVPGGQTFARLHPGATRALVHGAQDAGVRRFVQISALGVTDEGDTEYQRSKFEAEQIVRGSSLTWTILRPSFIHGPDGEFMRQVASWARGREAPYVFLPYFSRRKDGADTLVPGPTESARIAPVFVGDVAQAVLRALDREQAGGEIYNLVGSETLDWPEFLTWVRDHVPLARRSLRPRAIPAPVAWRLARGARLLGLRDALPFDEGMARMAARDATATLEKLRDHLGLEPRPFKPVMAEYASAM